MAHIIHDFMHYNRNMQDNLAERMRTILPAEEWELLQQVLTEGVLKVRRCARAFLAELVAAACASSNPAKDSRQTKTILQDAKNRRKETRMPILRKLNNLMCIS